jgi:heme oxygenase (biliverdin-IX-beta and delta-forming)
VTGPVPRFGNAAICEATLLPALRDVLRSATSKPHERLHQHGGLAAVAAGTIDRSAYTALLARLYGFHHSFELAAQTIPERTRWLEFDLAALGLDAATLLGLPRCTCFPALSSPDYLLGASYVVEGSALGGRGLARQLDGLLGTGMIAGRRFFSGHGTETGEVWRSYLARLSSASTATASRAAIVAGAVATFTIFEQWLEGWNKHHD